MTTLFGIADVATQPRFLLPALFPVIVYLSWRWDDGGTLRTQLGAALGIDGLGFVMATVLESQSFDGALINVLQSVVLLVIAVVIYAVWRLRGWSDLVVGWSLVAGLSVLLWLPAQTVLTLSGGVLVPTATVAYLTFRDRRFALLLPVSPFRIVVGVTTEGFAALDVVAALALAAVAVLVVVALPAIEPEQPGVFSGS